METGMETGSRSLEDDAGSAGFSHAANAPDAAAPTRPWAMLLHATIESEILPRLLATRGPSGPTEAERGHPTRAELAAFVQLVIAERIEAVRAVAEQVILQAGGREALLQGWLAPAAVMLGDLWERDECDFTSVTIGIYRLDQILKETATAGDVAARMSGRDRRILLLPAPGEPHSFGLAMVADAFREAGWCVSSGPSPSRAHLLGLVQDEWFDMVGLSVTLERHLVGLPACLRAMRAASCNQSVQVMLGGRAIAENSDRARFLGADFTAGTAEQAVADANIYFGASVTKCLHPYKTRFVDIG